MTAADLPPIEFEPSKQISGGTLKDYQRTGVNWLCTRYVYAIPGAIVRPFSPPAPPSLEIGPDSLPLSKQLADEMGTGKTLQTIAVFAFILDNFYKPEDQSTDKPLIVVLPKAVLRNWERELEKCVLSLSSVQACSPSDDEPCSQVRAVDPGPRLRRHA